MAQFAYKARRRTGEVVQGVLDVADRAAALAQIERLGLFPVMIDASKAGVAVAGAADRPKQGGGLAAALPAAFRRQRQRKPKLPELATFTRQLSNLLKCGMPLTVALESMSHLESKGIPSDVSKDLKQDVMEGKSLSDAMIKQPEVFSDLYVNMVRAGEQSGALVEVLKRLAAHYERFAEVQAKFISALIYPAIVACVGVVIVIFFMTFMLPKFMTIFEGLKVELPLATRILKGISQFFGNIGNWFIMGLVGAAIVVIFVRFKSTPQGKRKLDQWKMNAPILGK